MSDSVGESHNQPFTLHQVFSGRQSGTAHSFINKVAIDEMAENADYLARDESHEHAGESGRTFQSIYEPLHAPVETSPKSYHYHESYLGQEHPTNSFSSAYPLKNLIRSVDKTNKNFYETT